MTGSFFVSDAGRAKGGFEYTATYSAMLAASNGSGTLNLTLSIGLGDSLTQRVYAVSNLSVSSSRASTLLNGRPVRLDWTANDTVWNGKFSNNFIASWGPNSPQNELSGIIAPTIFQGLYEGYYFEMRLVPAQHSRNPASEEATSAVVRFRQDVAYLRSGERLALTCTESIKSAMVGAETKNG